MKNEARFYRDSYNAARMAILKDITDVLMKAPDNELQLDDNRGSLVVNTIDDQYSEVIMRVWIKYQQGNKAKVMVAGGVYEEDWDNPLDEYPLEKMIDVLEAVEVATK